MDTKFIIIWGMHRSGTSLMTRALSVFGANLGDFFVANISNPKGYFEDLGLIKLDEAMLTELGMTWDSLSPVTENHVQQLIKTGFLEKAVNFLKQVGARGLLVALKDPRMTRLAPFWRRAFHQVGLKPISIVSFRNPFAVINSLAKRAEMLKYPTLVQNPLYGAYLWLGYTLASLIFTTGYPRILVEYDSFLHQPRAMLLEMANKLALSINEQELDLFCDKFIDRSLNHAPREQSFYCNLPKRVENLNNVLINLPKFSFPTPAQIGKMWPNDQDSICLCAFLDMTLKALRANVE